MSLVDTPLIHSLTRALDLTSLRQRVVSENIANIDTPGYQTRDIDFAGEFQRALSQNEDDAAVVPVQVRTLRGLEERPDGNNVSIDRESLLMAQNQLQFQTGVAVLRSEFSRLQLAISGGSNS
ncbi:MAG: flagellar basal body protein [Candidatus Korobacteraceae bacterium]